MYFIEATCVYKMYVLNMKKQVFKVNISSMKYDSASI